ncbi:MAG: hypothetical protein A3B96_03495 [Candidatus Spechtbacteria bacterium RIFCSPHIGHO2_02_FULL_43_15b]|uniref:Uncharacterized protein n=1 Tax=Candidatus Spechtbacteria bacterium RIFCSPHIGHO2_01_FULL_43_30 TaxID=1802158 RepID=A0A1G2H8I4_9BACT|nr:MAG: hypothetical protein A2827_02350 [Candidatus Spechtbacteria bacterium RIFCSPHIGHO2_01_FULL_43_30]OGZ59413.1 MAG: hypothetical protein A3B96_03495 [Candidatus Spechtbacteria bacterium RIFCSPHIGHO2_02_FULL_43_15b]
MLRRDELQKQIEATEGRMQQMRVLEMDLRKSKSLLIRTEMEIKRLLAEKSRLQRELPLIESEIRKVEMERRFGANKGDLISRE